jgi:hypothetical protein
MSLISIKELCLVLLTFFFLCGSIGIWSVIVDGHTWNSYPRVWAGELSVDIVGIIFLMLAILFLIPQLEVIAVEGEK